MADTPTALPENIDDLEAMLMSGYSDTPAADTPVVDTPVVDTPVVETHPAPVVEDPPADPNALRVDLAKNFRITAQNAIEQRTLQIRAQNHNLTLAQALNQAHEEAGLTMPMPTAAPAAPAVQAPVEPTPAADPVAEIDAQITDLETQLTDLNPALDAAEWNRLNKEIRGLERQQATLAAEQRVEQRLTQQSTEQSNLQIIQQDAQAAAAEFPDLAAEGTLFQQRFTERERALLESDSPLLEQPDYAQRLARAVATELAAEGVPFTRKPISRPAASPQASVTVTQPASAAAASATPAASPRSAAAPLSGASASMIPVMGITQPDPTANIAAAIASNDLVSVEEMLMGRSPVGGSGPSQRDPRFHSLAA